MKSLVFWVYAGLYLFIAASLVIVEIASIKVGWSWISTLVKPMGLLFLIINVPLALFAVVKIGHVVFLHSVKHHKNVMRSIREMDISPYPASVSSAKNISAQYGLQASAPIAKIASAKIAGDSANFATDEIDEQIMDAMQQLVAQHQKPTGIAVSTMTGIPQRTVYDRIAKMKE